MKKLLLKSSILIFSLPIVYSCTSTKYIDNFIGTYKIDTAYEKKVHHYISGNEKVISENPLPYSSGGMFIDISKNGDAIVRDKNKTYSIKGKINTSSETECNFKDLAIEDGFKFKKMKNNDNRNMLYHSYTSSKVGFEYDYITRVYSMIEYFDPNDFNNVIGEYYIDISRYTYDWEYDGQHKSSKDDNYKYLKGGKVLIKEDKSIEVKNYHGDVQTGSISFDNSKVKFNLNDDKPFILSNMDCYFRTEVGSYFDIHGYLEVKKEIDTNERYTKETYSISMRKSLQ